MRVPLALSLAVAALTPAFAQESSMDWIRPRALRPGDTVAIVAPANSIAERDMAPAVESIERLGFRVRLPSNQTLRRGNFAGDDEARAAAFMEAWLDPEVDGVWCATGGYGTMRLYDLLDFEAIRAHPKLFCGMSDITGLHLALGRRARLITFLGPNAIWPITRDNLSPCVFAQTWFLRAVRADLYRDASGGLLPPYTFAHPQHPRDPQQEAADRAEVKPLNPGRAQGRLTGGNLSLIAATAGTPYEIETSGRILVLEDVREQPYRLDRMLCQLELAGLLERPAGVVLGTWHGCQPDNPERSLTVDEVMQDYFAGRPYPVIMNFPTGHVPEQTTLPLGAMAELDADALTLRLLEIPVTLD